MSLVEICVCLTITVFSIGLATPALAPFNRAIDTESKVISVLNSLKNARNDSFRLDKSVKYGTIRFFPNGTCTPGIVVCGNKEIYIGKYFTIKIGKHVKNKKTIRT